MTIGPEKKRARHKWGEPTRFLHKTERACKQCPIVKVSRHEFNQHWVVFFKDAELIICTGTPPCEGAAQ